MTPDEKRAYIRSTTPRERQVMAALRNLTVPQRRELKQCAGCGRSFHGIMTQRYCRDSCKTLNLNATR